MKPLVPVASMNGLAIVGFAGPACGRPVVAAALHDRQPGGPQRIQVERGGRADVRGSGERIHFGHGPRAEARGPRRRHARSIERDAGVSMGARA